VRLADSETDKLADYLEGSLGGADRCVYKNYPQQDGRVTGTVSRVGFPVPELITTSTFGLAHADWTDKNFADRVELVGAWNDPKVEYSRVLAVVARESMRQHVLPKPGVVFQDAIRAAAVEGPSLDSLATLTPHVLLLFPYLWGKEFYKCDLAAHRVWFLQVVPLFDDERKHIEQYGFKAFEEILSFDGARFTDLNRLSHIGTY
jgi:hypothetical protein